MPTDVRNVKHERDIIVNAIARIHCWLQINLSPPSFSPSIFFRKGPMSLLTKVSVIMPCETHVLGRKIKHSQPAKSNGFYSMLSGVVWTQQMALEPGR